jgi:hypothetical protein
MFRENSTGGMPKRYATPTALKADLELDRILENMADGDKTMLEACEQALLRPLYDIDAIKYRQETLTDALDNAEIVRRLYDVAATPDSFPGYYLSPVRLAETFSYAVDIIKSYTRLMRELRDIADTKLSSFKSEGFKSLLAMFQRELSDEYFANVREHMNGLKDVDNVLVSAKLGRNLQSYGYTLRRKDKGYWLHWHLAPAFSVNAEENPNGLEDLHQRRILAINAATSVLIQAAEFQKSFFNMLRRELSFYVGCLNLTDKMRAVGMPLSIPTLLPLESRERKWHNLYDVSLSLSKASAVVGNDLEIDGKHLYIITGANQGGKSTFVRSLGQAQLMAQCGMLVGAESFAAPLRRGVFTHFIREEDRNMRSGKLDEELKRMRDIVDQLEPGALMMFNESFSSTNEREGSEIGRQITKAMLENNVEVFSVTHLFMFADSYIGDPETLFLRAQRREDAQRTFKIEPGEQLKTAFGEDIYNKLFGTSVTRG